MKVLQIVVRGSYDEREFLHVFDDKQAAEQWALEYNATVRWSSEDDRARVEEIGYTPRGSRPPAP